jgi:CheY-like chemotaxis protein
MSLNILVVEDDVASLELISEVLRSVDAEVTAVSDAENASAFVAKANFDGIFLDLLMPKIDGLTLARMIRKSPRNKATPIIVVTGRDDKGTVKDSFAAGATFYLQKPIDRRKLMNLFKVTRGSMVQNRRRFMRVPLRTEVVCQLDAESVRGQCCNLSESGMLFEAGRHLKPGSSVRLSFKLPTGGSTIYANGVIARADEKQRIGVRFTSLNKDAQQKISDLVTQFESDNKTDVQSVTSK